MFRILPFAGGDPRSVAEIVNGIMISVDIFYTKMKVN
mgnify:CR=1 FL=1